MNLSKRLEAVAHLVTQGNRVADIGCDHAYTSIYMMKEGISSTVIAMDVNQGPIDRARENIDKYNYTDKIQIRKSNGLEKLVPSEVDTVLIAGMGGGLIVQILMERPEVVANLQELVLQPQSEIHKVRMMLSEQDFVIIKELMLKEDGKYYVMMKAQKRSLFHETKAYELSREEHFYYGKLLLEEKNPILFEFLLREMEMNKAIYEALLTEPTNNSLMRQQELTDELKCIECALRYYDKEE